MPPSVRAPIEAASAKGMIVLLGFLEAVSSGQRVEVATP